MSVDSGRGAMAAPTSKHTVHLIYGCFAMGVASALFLVPGIVLAYAARRAACDPVIDSHMTWLIRTFWIAAAGFLLVALLWFLGMPAAVLMVPAVVLLWRLLVGWRAWTRRLPAGAVT